jgi:predicted ATPase
MRQPLGRSGTAVERSGAGPTNLPIQRSWLIGRERELAAAVERLLRDDVGVLTLTGPGGVGKTRLALQIATSVADHFSHGVFVIELAALRDVDLVPQTILRWATCGAWPSSCATWRTCSSNRAMSMTPRHYSTSA